MAASMTAEEIRAFLDSRPGWIALTTLGREGFPHTVPIGYFREGDAIFMGCRAGSQKTKNVERNPQVSLMLESGGSMGDIKGLLIQGHASVVHDDATRVLELSRESARRRGTAEAELPVAPDPDSAFIEVRPARYISWDYSKEG
jgi:nitroimidazol reductase NimA-like FMN-containing flavoprotein (pyridoxamine 5'-phosphate oxidase superfamily)